MFLSLIDRQNYLFRASQNKSKESSLIQSGNRMSTQGKLIPSEFSLEVFVSAPIMCLFGMCSKWNVIQYKAM